ncbi:MAG: hypothetical protein GF334_12795 [Candidatus Altiarchaeales archaeon]|nr:hypothetical protein [Candidatus Altiarchaeales archaeon]
MVGKLNTAKDRFSRTVEGRKKEITAAYTALATLAVLYVGMQFRTSNKDGFNDCPVFV